MTGEYITLIGIIISGGLTYLGVTYKYRKSKPKDPTTQLFEYYEQMLKNMWEQSQAKDELISRLESTLTNIQQELWNTKQLLAETKQQLAEASRNNELVQKNITATREAMKASKL